MLNSLRKFHSNVKVLFLVKFRYFSSFSSDCFTSKFSDITIPDVTISDFLWEKSNQWPTQIALLCSETGRRYTYNEIFKKSRSFSGYLQLKLKLRKDETLAVILPNIPEYPIIVLGALEAGLKVTTINPRYTKDEIKRQLINSETRAVVVLNDIAASVQEISKTIDGNLPIISVLTEMHQVLQDGTVKFSEIVENSFEFQRTAVNSDDVALMLSSSGTTGLPKGVQLTHKNLVANQLQINEPELNLASKSEKNVFSGWFPFFHSGGMGATLLSSLSQGCTLVTTTRYESKKLLEDLTKFRPNVGFYPPAVVQMLTNNPKFKRETLECLTYIHTSGAPLSPGDLLRFSEKVEGKVRVIGGYGLTETSPMTTRVPLDDPFENKLGSGGIILPNTKIKIIPTSSDNGNSLPPNQPGEILVKGPQVMKGYFKNPKATSGTFTKDGWLRTGDLGYVDEDGYIFVTDRLKELIKVKGFQVAPAELEELLRSHPDVYEAAVVGVRHQKFGEVPKAFVILKDGKRISELKLKEYVAEKVINYKHLEGGVVFVDNLPKSDSGKILRRELKSLCG